VAVKRKEGAKRLNEGKADHSTEFRRAGKGGAAKDLKMQVSQREWVSKEKNPHSQSHRFMAL
jgi:hypothetical protein